MEVAANDPTELSRVFVDFNCNLRHNSSIDFERLKNVDYS